MKHFYLTTGTRDFLETIAKKHEDVILSHGSGHSVLFHETAGPSIFQTPRSYQVISAIGELQPIGYFVLNNIPVTDEGRPIFEYRFTSRQSKLEEQPGFVAFRLLRPIDGDTYIVLTEWEDPAHFEQWKESQDFKGSHSKNQEPANETNAAQIFASQSYVTTYRTRPMDEEYKEDTIE